MPKTKKTRADIYKRDLVISESIAQLRDTAAKEQRELTAEEKAQLQAFVREKEGLSFDLAQMPFIGLPTETRKRASAVARDLLLRDNRKVTIQLREEGGGASTPTTGTDTTGDSATTSFMVSDDVADTGIIPVAQQEMLKPVRIGLIWDKVGISIRTGLPAGKLRWPRHTKATAQWAGEGERLIDSKIDFDKLETKPVRLGLGVPVTRELLESTEGVVESVVRQDMPEAIVEKINDALFAISDTYSDGEKRSIVGPLVKAYANATVSTAALPTRKELLKAKASIVSKIKPVGMCFVMNEATKAEYEDTKVDAGSGRFVCENDKILGYPVFTTPGIPDGDVVLGDWSYQAAGFFGAMNLIVDPMTLARQNSVDFVLNAHFGMATLNDDAFVYLKGKKS